MANPNRRDAASSRTTKLLESLGLDVFYQLFRETKGVSSASVPLLALNWKGYYIGSELQGPVGKDDLKFLGLQFAAKILELLAVASLSTVMLALIRGQLLTDSLPFGAVTVGYEFSKLSLLCSKGFVAIFATRFYSTRRKRCF